MSIKNTNKLHFWIGNAPPPPLPFRDFPELHTILGAQASLMLKLLTKQVPLRK